MLVPEVILITGIMAAGKSTVAEALARRLPRSVHLRGDVFRRMVANGCEEMSALPTDEALRQLRLRYRLAQVAAREYVAAGFTVVVQDIVIGDLLQEVIESYAALELRVFVLCPDPEVVSKREAGRTKTGYGPEFGPRELDRVFRTDTPRANGSLPRRWTSRRRSMQSSQAADRPIRGFSRSLRERAGARASEPAPLNPRL